MGRWELEILFLIPVGAAMGTQTVYKSRDSTLTGGRAALDL